MGKNPKQFRKKFPQKPNKKRKLVDSDDDVSIESDQYDDDNLSDTDNDSTMGSDVVEEDDEVVEETAAEKRRRLAMETVERVRDIARRVKDDDEDDEESGEREGERDSLVAKILQQEQMEKSRRVRREIANRIKKPAIDDGFQVLVKHRQPVTGVALSEDDCRGFSCSKDGTIVHWDVESGKQEKYQWPDEEVLRSHGAKDPQGRAEKHTKQVLALAVSSDGRYLASGGVDRHVHLWDTRTRQHLQAFPGHRGPVSCLTFREGSSELFSGSYDRTVKIWNVEDRTYVNTLFGHQSEILAIDCLRKERVLTAGRDRTMQLFKVPEESRLVFLAPAASLECCCFIDNDEFLSGSDDGSIELWGVMRKKPVFIVKNAHALPGAQNNSKHMDNGSIPNGHTGYNKHDRGNNLMACSWVSSVTVCSGSDLAASGSGNGFVRLWALGKETKDIRPLYDLPLVGFANSLVFARSGKFLLAGVGQEPRLGRWGCLPSTRNGVAIQSLELL